MDEVLDGDEACGGVDITWNHRGREGKEVARWGHVEGKERADQESRNSLTYARDTTCRLGGIINTVTGNVRGLPTHCASRTRCGEQKRCQHCLPGTFGIQDASEHHHWVSSYGRRAASSAVTTAPSQRHKLSAQIKAGGSWSTCLQGTWTTGLHSKK